MSDPVLVDTGPLVALLDANDGYHDWASKTFKDLPGPLLTCEPVLAEAFHLMRRYRPAQEKILALVERRALNPVALVEQEAKAIRILWSRYENVPMSLADACLVRMAELYQRARICTLDMDFRIYRINNRDPLELISP